jgi:hypothetical protein
LLTGKVTTVVGILLSIGAAYFASMYDNSMDIIQLVFGFVNATLFATFPLGMFWKRTTGTGAFLGLFGGIAASTLSHSLTIARGNPPGAKGGYLHLVRGFPSEMAQNFWLAGLALIVCFSPTLVVSLATSRTKSDADLKDVVYSITPKSVDDNIPILSKAGRCGRCAVDRLCHIEPHFLVNHKPTKRSLMGLDIRWLIGLMFTIIGLLITLFGVGNKSESVLPDININFNRGIVLLVFGWLMLHGAIRGLKARQPT